MNPTYYFGVMVRLFAIALFIYGLGKLEPLTEIALYGEDMYRTPIVIALMSSMIPILLSILIWFFPLTIAKGILPPMEVQIEKLSSNSLLTVLVIAIGTYALYYAFLDGIYWFTVANIFITDEFGVISESLSNQDKAYIVETIFELVFAIILITRARTISKVMINFSK